MKHRRTLILFVLVGGLIIALSIPASSKAYKTFRRWPTSDGASATYSIDPNISANLFVTDAISPVRAAASTWNGAGVFALFEEYWPNESTISTQNFVANPFCTSTGQEYAIVCREYNASQMLSANMKFNTFYSWNTSGVNNTSTRDVQSIMTHEFGHFLSLDHTPVANCALTDGSVITSLCEDDKRGINQLYGPFTGFDGGRADLLQNHTTFYSNVTSYFLYTVSAENGVTPWYGNKMKKITGNATTSNNSYVYFKVISIDTDTGNDVGTLIPQDVLLKWCQYNQLQTTMSIDATFSDGTSLRNYSVHDQYGVPVAAWSRSGPLNQWACYEANLNPVAGKTVNHWYIAFDGRSSYATSGTFRAYFDSIRFVWPGRSVPTI